MGQIARADNDLEDAVSQLPKAIHVNKDFELAYLALGYAYADQGEFQKANDQLSFLESKNSAKTTTLEKCITPATQPTIIAAVSLNGFNTSAGPKEAVSALKCHIDRSEQVKIFFIEYRIFQRYGRDSRH